MSDREHRKSGTETYLRVVLLLLRIILMVHIIVLLVRQHLG